MHYKRWCGNLAKRQMRLDIEDLVKQRSSQLEGWRVRKESVTGQFVAGFLADMIVSPVPFVVDKAVLYS